MSWKACAYVKELTVLPNGQPLTMAGKLVLFCLADAHNSDRGRAWPSMPKLASDALMSERNLRRVLKQLEAGGVIRITRPTGNRSTCEYEFPAMQMESREDKLSSQLQRPGRTPRAPREDTTGIAGGQIRSRNKEEPQEPPENRNQPEALDSTLRVIAEAHPRPVRSQATEAAIVGAVASIAKDRGCSTGDAAEWLLGKTREYAAATARWPVADRQFIARSDQWFSKGLFTEPSEYWRRGQQQAKPRRPMDTSDTRGVA